MTFRNLKVKELKDFHFVAQSQLLKLADSNDKTHVGG